MLTLDYKAVLLDIEGTTTAISFVYDTLFPYAKRRLEAFLVEHWHDAAVQSDIQELRRQSEVDLGAGIAGAVVIPEDDTGESTVRRSAIESILWQMDNDRKTTGLKSLQGRIWFYGFDTGALKGHIYDDVAGAFQRWSEHGVPISIYSSGSVNAQKLLFGHSEAGDLTPLLTAYFDTTTGPKKESSSYVAIASALGHAPSDICFVTDSLAEADAASEAGLQVALSVRPGNPPVPAHNHRVIETFDALFS